MTISITYIVTDTRGGFIDWADRVGVFSILGKQAKVFGSGANDGVFVQAGASADLSELGGGGDTVYLSGRLQDYQQSVDTETNTYTLTRIHGLGVGQSEVIRFTLTGDADEMVFADGRISLDPTVNGAIAQNGVAQSLSSAMFIAGGAGTPGGGPNEVGQATTHDAPVWVVVQQADGLSVPQAAQRGQVLKVYGSGGDDSVYVREGSSVDATEIGGGNDRVYLTGRLQDYTQSIDAGSNQYMLTRTGLAGGAMEVVRFTLTGDGDEIVFADGRISLDPTVNGAIAQNGVAQPLSSAMFMAGGAGTPGLGPTVTGLSVSDGIAPANRGKGGQSVNITVSVSEAVSVSANATFTFQVGGSASDTFTATLSPIASASATDSLVLTGTLPAAGDGAIRLVGINGGTLLGATSHQSADYARLQAVSASDYTVDNTAPLINRTLSVNYLDSNGDPIGARDLKAGEKLQLVIDLGEDISGLNGVSGLVGTTNSFVFSANGTSRPSVWSASGRNLMLTYTVVAGDDASISSVDLSSVTYIVTRNADNIFSVFNWDGSILIQTTSNFGDLDWISNNSEISPLDKQAFMAFGHPGRGFMDISFVKSSLSQPPNRTTPVITDLVGHYAQLVSGVRWDDSSNALNAGFVPVTGLKGVDTQSPTIAGVPDAPEAGLTQGVAHALADLSLADLGGSVDPTPATSTAIFTLSLVATNGQVTGITDADATLGGDQADADAVMPGLQIKGNLSQIMAIFNPATFTPAVAGSVPTQLDLTLSDPAGNATTATYDFVGAVY